jgi:hypothetical protein
MFTFTQMRALLHESPFRPFRIRLTDGRSFEIPHPDFAFLTAGYIEVGLEPNAEGAPQVAVCCALIHIVSVDKAASQQAA